MCSENHNFFSFYALFFLFWVCTLLYYFGELVDFAGWRALRWEFFYNVHDIQRLFFFAPVIYACYFFGVKAMVIVTAASLIVFLPRAIFISPFHDALPRALLFTIIAGVACSFIRIARNKIKQCTSVECVVGNERNEVVGVRNRIEAGVFTAGPLEVDLSRRLVKRRGQIVKLTPKEYELLAHLVRNSGKVLTHRELLNGVWGPQYGHESEYIRNYIAQLRRKIEDDPSNPQFIMTESRFGYRFLKPENPYT